MRGCRLVHGPLPGRPVPGALTWAPDRAWQRGEGEGTEAADAPCGDRLTVGVPACVCATQGPHPGGLRSPPLSSAPCPRPVPGPGNLCSDPEWRPLLVAARSTVFSAALCLVLSVLLLLLLERGPVLRSVSSPKPQADAAHGDARQTLGVGQGRGVPCAVTLDGLTLAARVSLLLTPRVPCGEGLGVCGQRGGGGGGRPRPWSKGAHQPGRVLPLARRTQGLPPFHLSGVPL